MSVEPGQTLLHYRVVEKIGEGGMGVVWRARCTSLDRDVAIKVLPATFADDAERLARFEREAKLLASINHPNIAAVYGLHEAELDGSDGPIRFIAMELVEGEDLSERLARGTLTVDETRAIATQIASGLDTAHERGIVHRDLKPANVRISPDGLVKILDFGLAKACDPASDTGEASVTLTSGGTSSGMILGTASYMSPEQARGEPCDKRTDIWSFGCVLYECLTGTRAFPGRTVSDAISAVLRVEPDFAALPPETPGAMRLLLRRCLAKNARERLRDIGDAAIELRETDDDNSRGLFGDAGSAEANAEVETLRERVRVTRGWNRALLAAVVLVAVIGGVLAWQKWSVGDSGVSASGTASGRVAAHWSIHLPENATLDTYRTSANLSKLGGGSPILALAPDGATIVYSVASGGGSRLYRHRLDTLEAAPIDGTEGGRGPFVSPDGRWVGFLADNQLKVAPLDGGGARRVCDVSSQNFAGGFASDGEHVIYSTNKGLWRVPVDGGEPELLAAPRREEGEGEFSFSQVLPDGAGVLFTTGTATGAKVARLGFDGGPVRTVLRDAAHARYLGSGHLVYEHAGSLWSVGFDPSSGTVSGTPTVLPIDGVHATLGAGGSPVAHFAVADNGVLTYVPAQAVPSTGAVFWVDREGNETLVVEGPGRWEHPRVSPDGKRLAFDILDADGKDIFIYDIARGQLDQLTHGGAATAGLWTRDGSRLIGSDLASNGLVSFAADFSGDVVRIPNAGHTTPGGWDRDGRTALFAERDADGGWAIGRVRTDTPNAQSEQLLRSSAGERWPAVSPDGKWLAHVADDRGRREVFVRPYPALDRRVKVSSNGGGEPIWSTTGDELFYRQDGAIFSVSVTTTEGTFRAGTPRALFEGDYDAEPGGHQHWDVAPGGRRFALIRNVEPFSSELRVAIGVLP